MTTPALSPRHFFAVWLSRIFHPLFVAPLSLFAVQRLSGATSREATGWTVLACGMTLVPFLAFVFRRVRQGRYEDMDVSRREDRHVLYALAGVSLGALLATLIVLPAPPIVWWSMVTALAAMTIGAFINFLVHKVSLHVLTDTACATFLLFLWPPVGILLMLASLLVAWSRVYLNRHTVPDVVWGFAVGLLCSAVVFWLPLGLR